MEAFKLTLEIERLEEECSKHQTTMDDCEKTIKTLVGKNEEPEERQRIMEQWLKLVTSEERKSNAIWNKKREFFENLPTANSDQQQLAETDENYFYNWRRSRNTNVLRNTNGLRNTGIGREGNKKDTSAGNFLPRRSARIHR